MNSIYRTISLALLFFTFTKIAYNQEVKIDHVICVLKDIEKTTKEYENMGFTVKKGSLHKNGLINAHIKFQNQSSFELMSIKGKPGDAIAQNYEKLLSKGEGGVFIALTGISTKNLQQKLSAHNIKHHVAKTKSWTYVTFPDTSSLAHFFFIEYHVAIKDEIKTLVHSNNTTQISKVYVEGDEKVLALLKTIGLEKGGAIPDSDFGMVTEFKTPTGTISVVKSNSSEKRYRLKAVVFGKGDGSRTIKVHF